jgi:hypothetical protein
MKEIPLTQGQVALVSDEDYERVAQYKWSARWHPRVHNFYAIRNDYTGGKHTTPLMHRFIMAAQPGEQIDHRNGNVLDNRRENLRRCTAGDNSHNQHRHTPHSSIYKGVSIHKQTGKWQASVGLDGRIYYLGLYETQEQAARVYDAKARELHGEFASLNMEG